MCLGIPMQIDRIDGTVARCSAKGVSREVNLLLLEGQPVSAGDFVIVHVGYAIQKVSPAEARSAWELYDRMAEIEKQDANA
ncbi:MAG: HypC/HybG/HupF family hydrogenase formation chaperone [Burkholderiales bacterium]